MFAACILIEMRPRSVFARLLAGATGTFMACGDDGGGGGGPSPNDAGADAKATGDGSTSGGDAGADGPPVVPAVQVDTTFGANGVARTGRAAFEMGVACVVRQSTGKLVLVGRTAAFSQTEGDRADIVALRLDASGQRDASFGLAGSSFRLVAMGIVAASALLNDGTRRRLVLRFTADGALDTTFAGKGYLLDAAAGETHGRVVVQAEGKILVASSNASVTRYLADGLEDSGWNGKTTGGLGSQIGVDLALQPDGKALLLATGGKLEVYRFDDAGVLDNTFATNGKAAIDNVAASSLGVDVSGNIVVEGYDPSTSARRYFRFTAGGTRDDAFGASGVVMAANDLGLHVEPDGRFVVIRRDGSTGAKLARYLANGSALDDTFGTAGVTANTATGAFTSIARAADGQLFLAGTTAEGAPRVVSWDTSGATATGFGTSGEATTTGGPSREILFGVVEQPDGTIVGMGVGPYTPSTFLARWSNSGALDTSFGTNGYAAQTIGGWEQVGNLKNDAAGNLYLRLRGGARIVKLSPAGLRDDTYAGTIEFGFQGFPVGESLATFSDGRVAVAGGGGPGKLGVGILAAGGAPDPAFGGGTGKSAIDVPGVSEVVQDVTVAVAADGKIVVAGATSTQLVVARFDGGGPVDATFGGGGTGVFTAGVMEVSEVLPAADGSIMIVGMRRGTGPSAPSATLVVARVTSSGGLDTAFGVNGVLTRPLTVAADGESRLATAVLLADGSLLVATGKSADDGVRSEMLFLRFTTKGALVGETVVPPSKDNDVVYAMTRTKDGKLLAAGTSWTETSGTDMALVRLQ